MILCPQCQTINEVSSPRCAGCGASLDGGPSALGSDPYIGRQLGDRFFLQSFLGSGEIGLVYRGTDISTSQDVAVKLVHPDVAANIGDRLLRSAVAISQVRHPKLASVLAAAREHDGALYIATEYLKGTTLKQLLEHNGPLGPRRAADILFQLASALAPIHKVGRPHANLKPENVFLVERDGTQDFVRVCDVGVPDLFGVRKTAQGAVIIGSPKYFSPEQAQGQPATVLSDQFTLGIIAYQLLTGALPFFGATPDQLLAAIAAGTPTPIARRTPGIQLPPKLEQIISKCLNKQPGERYADLRALATDVASVIKSTQPEAAPARKKGFVQASTVMADPGLIGTLQSAADDDEEEYEDSDRTSVREVVWSAEKTGPRVLDDLTPAVSTMGPTRPSPPQAPPTAPRSRPPTQNDMINVPPPLMLTGALDSSDLQAALDSATSAGGRNPSGTPAARRPSFDDDLQAALAAASAEVGAAPAPKRAPMADPFSDANLSDLTATPAGSAAALASAPSGRPSTPGGGARLTHDIMSAIDEELEDASVNSASQAGAPGAPLASMEDLKEIRKPSDGAAVSSRIGRGVRDGGNRNKIVAAALLLLVGGGAGAFFLLDEAPAPVPRAAGPTRPGASPGSSGAPATTPPSAALAGPAAGSATPTAAITAPPSIDPDEPGVVTTQRAAAALAAAKAAGSGAPSGPAGMKANLTSEPSGAKVMLGDKTLGITPLEVALDSGAPQKYTLQLEGYQNGTVTADPASATPGEVMALNTKLAPGAVAERRPERPANPATDAVEKPTPKPSAPPPAPKPKPKPKPKPPSTVVEDPF